IQKDAALARIANTAQDIADRELTEAAHELGEIEHAASAEPREQRFRSTDQKLTDAIQRLDQLIKDNEKIAKQRLEQQRLELAAAHQQQLADRTKELEARDPYRDPNYKADRDQLQQEQRELATELQRLSEQSETLKSALDALRAEQLKQDADTARA